MKILYVETKMDGHHRNYIEFLAKIWKTDEVYAVLPVNEKIGFMKKDHIFNIDFKNMDIKKYIHWMIELKKVIKNIDPDIVHFVYGDDLYRYCALGMKMVCREAKIVFTCHQIRRSKLRDFSFRCIGKQSDAIVVHTTKLERDLKDIDLTNIFHIEYPQFRQGVLINQENALKKLGINNQGKKVLLSLGGTREDKGLDILLEALKQVDVPFYFIIAGKEEKFDQKFIMKEIETYKENVFLLLKFLSDEELELCLNAADIIVLPYRKKFDGASGPLGEGVWYYKQIIGADHKSLGCIIRENHLGETFEAENVESLTEELKTTLLSEWKPDEIYRNYRSTLNPGIFQKCYQELYKLLMK